MQYQKIKYLMTYFTKEERLLWSVSVICISVSFFLFNQDGLLTLIASLIGVTSLLFNAKGNPFGQFLMVIFSVFYGVISYTFAYYGEMITYMGMSAPMALFAFLSWMNNPYNGNKAEVKINRITQKETLFMFCLSAVVTMMFYFLLRFFQTANLLLSTLSITTSFLAVYLTYRRSIFFTLAYAANDIVLIFLWILAIPTNPSYLSVVICFMMFLINDVYGFFNWSKRQKRQMHNAEHATSSS